eukprot:Rmarinus@m.4994
MSESQVRTLIQNYSLKKDFGYIARDDNFRLLLIGLNCEDNSLRLCSIKIVSEAVCKDEACRRLLCSSVESVRLLLGVLFSPDPSLRYQAAKAFSSIAQNSSESLPVLHAEGVTTTLAAVLPIGDLPLKRVCVVALAKLSPHVDAAWSACMDVSAYVVLSELLTDTLPVIRSSVVVLLWKLAEVQPSNCRLIRQAGCLPHLLSQLCDSDSDKTARASAVVIWTMATAEAESRQLLVAAGGVSSLISAVPAVTGSALFCVVDTLAKLAWFEPRSRQLIRDAGGIPLLVSLLRTPKVSKKAAVTLWKLSESDVESRQLIRDFGGIPPLMTLLRSGDEETLECVLSTLINVIMEDAESCRLLKHSSCYPLVERMSTDTSSALHSLARALVQILATATTQSPSEADKELLQLLVSRREKNNSSAS